MTASSRRPGREFPLRVAVADDDAGVRSALADLLSADARFGLRGVFADGPAVRDWCRRDRVDVAVIDVAMPGGGPALAAELRTISPGTVIAVYTAHHDRRTRTSMLAAGASAILLKGRTTDLAAALVDLTQPT